MNFYLFYFTLNANRQNVSKIYMYTTFSKYLYLISQKTKTPNFNVVQATCAALG